MSRGTGDAMSEDPMTTATLPFRDVISSASRYWERRRLLYNAVLVAIVVLAFVGAWPESKQSLNLESLLALFILAVLANVAYCAAYLPDVLLQYSSFRAAWIKW